MRYVVVKGKMLSVDLPCVRVEKGARLMLFSARSPYPSDTVIQTIQYPTYRSKQEAWICSMTC